MYIYIYIYVCNYVCMYNASIQAFQSPYIQFMLSQGVHAAGMAHMDVKADNIYIGLHGGYRLGDFGLAASEDMLNKGD